MSQADTPSLAADSRSDRWRWLVCGILLTATFLNYANRAAYTQNATHIRETFTWTDTSSSREGGGEEETSGYGIAEGCFSWGFACGGLIFGVLADKVSVRWLYPAVLVAWSLAGLSRGLVAETMGLAVAHGLLGLFEAGHWPCALRTTQRTFKPAQRTLANSILQSGASLGAVVMPLVIVALHVWNAEQWRLAFFVAGAFGIPWAVVWLMTMSEADVQRPVIQTDESSLPGEQKEQEIQEVPLWKLYTTRRWWLLLFTVVCINTVWHYIRVWLPDTLEQDHGYSHEFTQYFTSAYYLATFLGSLIAGWLTSSLAKKGWPVHRSRMTVFFVCSVLSLMSVPAAFLPAGPALLGCLLMVAFGSLGLFPIYYSLNQELSAKHQGKVGGTLSFCAWSVLAVMQPSIEWILGKNPEARPYLFAGAGFGPLLAFVVLSLLWGKRPVYHPKPTAK